MTTIVTVVLYRDGTLKLASDKISETDAHRWTREGYHAFRLQAAEKPPSWSVTHVASGVTFSPATTIHDSVESIVRQFAALQPAQLRGSFGPCQGTIELIELTATSKVMVDDLDKFAKTEVPALPHRKD